MKKIYVVLILIFTFCFDGSVSFAKTLISQPYGEISEIPIKGGVSMNSITPPFSTALCYENSDYTQENGCTEGLGLLDNGFGTLMGAKEYCDYRLENDTGFSSTTVNYWKIGSIYDFSSVNNIGVNYIWTSSYPQSVSEQHYILYGPYFPFGIDYYDNFSRYPVVCVHEDIGGSTESFYNGFSYGDIMIILFLIFIFTLIFFSEIKKGLLGQKVENIVKSNYFKD